MTTYDPYKPFSRPATGIFRGVPSGPPGTVLVVDRARQELRTLKEPNDSITPGEARFGGIRTLYLVDVTDHELEFQETLPCSEGGSFLARIQLTCHVDDAEVVVMRGIHDAAQALVPAVTDTLKRVCRRHQAEYAGAAEEAAIAEIYGVEADGRHHEAFLITRASVTLYLDPAAAAFVQRLQEDRRVSARQQSEAKLAAEQTALHADHDQLRDRLEEQRRKLNAQHEQARMEDEAKLERERARLADEAREQSARLEWKRLADELELRQERQRLETQKLDLERERLELEHRREQMELEHRLAMDQKKFEFYLKALEEHDHGALVMRLVQDANAVEQVAALIAGQQAAKLALHIDGLTALLGSKAAEGWEFADQIKPVVTDLLTAVRRLALDQPAALDSAGRPQLVGGDSGTPRLQAAALNEADPAAMAADTASTRPDSDAQPA